jgi:hypothetical protein
MRLSGDAHDGSIEQALITLIGETASRQYVPKLYAQGHSQFQLTRGLLGLSL